MSYILNIESATNICSIAISKNGTLISHEETTTNNHASDITILIEKCLVNAALKINDMAAVAISNGPGSYTSLRVGASVAKGICYALGIPLMAIDTLKSLAQATKMIHNDEQGLYCPMIDARRMEVYYALFSNQKNKLETVEKLGNKIIDNNSFSEYLSKKETLYFSGNGAKKCQPIFTSPTVFFTDIVCAATHLIPLSTEAYSGSEFVDILSYTPQYFKAPNITTPKKVL